MGRAKRVYVVDDDSAVRSSTVTALSTLGFHVRSFDSSRLFLDEMVDFAPGCILLDVCMPEVDGFQFIEALGNKIDKFPVVITSGHADIATAVRAIKVGASDYIQKPLDEPVLAEILSNVFATLDANLDDAGEVTKACSRLEALAPREAEVLRALAEGLNNKMIAHRLDIGVRTVEMYRARMMHRLAVRSLSEALRLAYLSGWTRATAERNVPG